MSGLSEEDKLLFEQAMQDVVKLDASEKITDAPPKKRTRLPRNKTTRPGEPQPLDLAFENPVTAYESLLFTRPGSRTQDLAKLKKGDIQIQRRLDLHGHTEQTALTKLTTFIQQAQMDGLRYLLIIHGKGYNSDTGFPIIKNLVNQVLPQLFSVQGFCSAQPKDGGTGAVYVWLKSAKK